MSTITVPNLRYCGIAIGGWGILYVGAASLVALQGRVGDTPNNWGCSYPIGSNKVSTLLAQILACVTGMFVGLLQPHGFVIDARVWQFLRTRVRIWLPDRSSYRRSAPLRSINRSVCLIIDTLNRCSWNRKWPELEVRRHYGDQLVADLATCISTSSILIYDNAAKTNSRRLSDATRWSLSTRRTLA